MMRRLKGQAGSDFTVALAVYTSTDLSIFQGLTRTSAADKKQAAFLTASSEPTA